MALAPTFVAGREQCFQQIERLTNSHSLRGADALCRLLRYLADHSLAHPPTTVKEYQIATEVFGRPPDFDPQSDSTVRVQAGRLRTKLAEYYAGDGLTDPLIVKLPKGSYLLAFEWRTAESRHDSGVHHHEQQVQPPMVEPASRRGNILTTVLALCLAASLITIAVLIVRTPPAPALAVADTTDNSALRTFWRPLVSGPGDPWVIFSNAAFVGRPETGLRYYESPRDPKSAVRDHYTGVGEVLAIHELDQAFASMGKRLRVKAAVCSHSTTPRIQTSSSWDLHPRICRCSISPARRSLYLNGHLQVRGRATSQL